MSLAARNALRYGLVVLLVLLCPAMASGDSFRVLVDDREAIQARIDLIQQAQQEIVLAYYAVDQGRVPASLLAVLQKAAERGVRVRLIVDGWKSRFPKAMFDHLESRGIEVRSYHPLRETHPFWLNRRLHVKLLVVDGQQMIIGSRNLQDEHFGIGDDQFVDCDAYLCGASAIHGKRYFDWLWNRGDVRPIRRIDSPTYGLLNLRPFGDDPWLQAWRQAREPEDFRRLLIKSLAWLVQCQGIRMHTGNDWSAGTENDVTAALWHDVNPGKPQHRLERSLLALIDEARCEVLIESGYPAFSRATLRALLAARQRGVQVTLVTNSLSSIDNVAVYAAYQNTKRQLLKAGVQLWEFDGPATLHGKTLVVDSRIAMIGSYNFDPRSAYLNLELVVVTDDLRAAADLRNVVLQHRAGSQRVTSMRPVSAGERAVTQGEPDQPASVSAARLMKMRLDRLLMPAIRWLL